MQQLICQRQAGLHGRMRALTDPSASLRDELLLMAGLQPAASVGVTGLGVTGIGLLVCMAAPHCHPEFVGDKYPYALGLEI